MEASVRVILSASVACEAANEAVVAENVLTVSMRARKSLAERVMYCDCCVEVLSPATSDRTVGMGPEVCGEVEGIGACGTETRATREVADGDEVIGGDNGETGAGGSDYHHLARPCLIPEGEDGKLEAWPAIDQW